MVGRFSIISELGEGGMATVYRAYDPSFKREVAIKLLPQDRTEEGSYRQRFEREARTIANLEHDAIVPVYEYGNHDGQPFLVMRLMNGGSLADRLRNGPLSVSEINSILHRIGSALDKAHAKGIVHRDLKPANILFDDRGAAYLSDFGIVKVAEESTLTAVGQVVGTPAYMSPEQVLGERDIDGRADIYALGAILYQMLAGQLPYQSTTTMGMAMKHVSSPIPLLSEINPDLPAGYQEVINRAMAKDLEQRYHSGEEMAAAFATASEDAAGVLPLAMGATIVESPSWSTESTEVLNSQYPPPPPPSQVGGRVPASGPNWPLIASIIAAGVFLAIILFFIFFWLRNNESSAQVEDIDPTVQSLQLTLTGQADLIAAGSAGESADNIGGEGESGVIATVTPTLPPDNSTTASPTGTPMPTDTAVPSDTPWPTSTPRPSPTLPPLPTNTLAPTACAVAVHGSFSSTWEAQQTQLGCATSGAAANLTMAEENFAGGRMVWRSDNDKIYAIYSSGSWASFDDIWYEGDPSFSCGTEQSPPTPQRGFGKIWCTYNAVQQGLGSATNAEYGTSGTVQNFANGFIMEVGGNTKTFYYNGTWR